MNKGTQKITRARDICRKKACEKIAHKYKRSMDWAYKVARRDKTVQDGIYYEDAISDYEFFYRKVQQLLS